MTVGDGFRTRCLAAGLIALTAAVTVTATAEGWRRPSNYAFSSPDGGDYRVCRDGIRFEGVSINSGGIPPSVPSPADPTLDLGFKVFSPPPIDPVTRLFVVDPNTGAPLGTIVAEGTLTTKLQAVPYHAGEESFYWYYGAHKGRWSGGQLLEPRQDAVYFDTGSFGLRDLFEPARPDETDDIEDCLLFPPVTVCRDGKTISVPEDQVQPGDVRGECPPPPVTVCRDGRTIVIPENQVEAGDVRGNCSPPEYSCTGKRATIVGTARADTLRGTVRADVIAGLGGKDKLSGLGGNDRICGGTGNDTAGGGPGNDRVYGDSGNDRLSGDSGRDILRGGPGSDRLTGGRGRDTLIGGPGIDLRKQ